MKKLFLIFSIFAFISTQAQDSTVVAEKVVDKPVKNTFIASQFIYQQTVSSPLKGAFEMVYTHRFNSITNGAKMFYGIYGGAKVLIALNYGITDRIMVGAATTSKDLQNLNGKIAILKQTKENSMPISLSFYGNVGIDTRDKANYLSVYNSYKFLHRLSYFSQLMVARKFGKIASLQVSPYLAYYNAIEKDKMNLNYGTSVLGKVTIYNNISFIADYNQPLNKGTFAVQPGVSGGFEVGTSTHSFQLFVSNMPYIVQQANAVYNEATPFNTKYTCIGFNLTVRL